MWGRGPRCGLRLAAVVVALGSISISLTLSAQAPAFKTRAELVTVPITITDDQRRFVEGLTADDLDVFEDGVKRPVVQFSRERVPMSVSIVVDTSGSMSRSRTRTEKDAQWKDTRAAVSLFLESLADQDEASLSVFSTQPALLVDWTRDREALLKGFDKARIGGGTAIYRAVTGALRGIRNAHNRRTLILLVSDGIDHSVPDSPQGPGQVPPWATDLYAFRWQERTQAELALQKSETMVYAVGLATEGDAKVDLETLGNLTDPTGGYSVAITQRMAIPPAITGMIENLRAQYMLAFEPRDARDGQYHRITVSPHNPRYTVRAKAGYVASADR